MTEMRASSVVDRTRVYLDARLAVVLQQFVVVGTRTFDASFCVRAQMRTPSVILDTFVDVLADPAVVLQLVSLGTSTVESTVCVQASVRTACILERTFVDVLAVSPIVI